MQNKGTSKELQVKHLIYLGVFLLVFTLRMIAAAKLAITQPEADILFNLTGTQTIDAGRGSLLYQLLTLPLIQVFSATRLVVRFWPLLAGALLVLTPFLFEDLLGTVSALILACLFALDPFQNGASLQLSSGVLTVFTFILGLGLLHRKKTFAALLALLAFLLSGRAVFYPLILALFAYGVLLLQKDAEVVKAVLRDVIDTLRKKSGISLVILAGLVLALFLLKIPFSDSLNGILTVFTQWGQPFALGSSPGLFPVALVSYVPLAFLCLLLPARSLIIRKYTPFLLLGSFLALTLIALNPAHQVLDLAWVSIPLWVIAASKLGVLFERFGTYTTRVKIYTMIIISLLVSLSITAVMLVYQIYYGLDVVSNLLSTISLLIMTTMVVLFLAFNDTVPLALTALRIGLVVVVLVFQVAFAWRSLGLNGNPSGEILWNGYFEGEETVLDIIHNTDLTTIDAGLDMRVGLLGKPNSAVAWELSRNFPTVALSSTTTEQHLAVMITDSSEGLSGNTADGYYGQDFNARSYPLWIWQPLKNLSEPDFWFWLIFREGQMMRETNYVWVNKILF